MGGYIQKNIGKTLSLAIIAAMSVILLLNGSIAGASSNTTLKWATQTAAGSGAWMSVAWSPELGRFVAAGKQSTFPYATVARVMTSTNATNWDLVGSPGVGSMPNSGVWTSVTWSSELDLFVVVACNVINTGVCGTGGVQKVITSPDGYVWTARTTPDSTSTWQSVTWAPGPGLFVAVADSGGNSIMTSSNGITWTARTASEDNMWRSVTWSPELSLFVAVSGNGTNRVMTSPDGINWTARIAAEANTWTSVAWSPQLGKFVAVASDGTNRVMTSANGIAWTAHAASGANAWSSVVWAPELAMFVAVANSGTDRIMTSPDGENWTSQAASLDNAWNAVTWSPALETFVAVSNTGLNTTRAMTGSIITAVTNPATGTTEEAATLNGEYVDSYPGAEAFFRYRVAGTGDPFIETATQPLTTASTFNTFLTGLESGTAYEFTSVVQWTSAGGIEELEGGLQTFTTVSIDTGVPPPPPVNTGSSGSSTSFATKDEGLANTGQNSWLYLSLSGVLMSIGIGIIFRNKIMESASH